MKHSFLHRCQPVLAGTAIALTLASVLGSSVPAFAAKRPETIALATTRMEASQERWIEIDLSSQRLIAREGSDRIYEITISTGKAATPTPTGVFAIHSKLRRDRMRGADYDVPNVPHVMYFHRGYAVHGAHWHHRFGTPVSHGCINLPLEDAAWLYDWASVGTLLVIHD